MLVFFFWSLVYTRQCVSFVLKNRQASRPFRSSHVRRTKCNNLLREQKDGTTESVGDFTSDNNYDIRIISQQVLAVEKPPASQEYLEGMINKTLRSADFSFARLAMICMASSLAIPLASASTTNQFQNPAVLSTDWANRFLHNARIIHDSSLSSSPSAIDLSQRGGSRSPGPIWIKPSHWVEVWYKQVPEPLRFFISGNCGNVCFYYCEAVIARLLSAALTSIAAAGGTDEASSRLLSLIMASQDSISFLVGYFVHIVAQHWLHAALVYGLHTINTSQKYWTTLWGMYQALLTSAIGTTLLNSLLLQCPFLSKTAAFVLTMWIFSAINYFWIGWIVKRSENQAKSANATS